MAKDADQENTPLLSKNNSTPTLEDIASSSEPPRDANFKKRWLSISVAYAVNFILMLQNAIYWASLWPYLSQIDPTATQNFFGFVVMAFNLASSLAAPLLGFWSNRMHQTKIPIIAGIVINIAGNVLVAFVEAFDTNRKWVLLVGRFVTGFGIGNAGTIFTYIAMASLVHERNIAVTIRATVNSVATLMGPILQLAFVPVGYPGYAWGPFLFNVYTAPAWISAILGVIQIGLMVTVFKEHWVTVEKKASKSSNSSDLDNNEKENQNKPQVSKVNYDKGAACVCIVVRIVSQYCLAYDNTIGSPYSMIMFDWSKKDSVTYNNIIIVVIGLIMIVGNVVVGKFVLKVIKERTLLLIGMSLYFVYYIITFSWPGLSMLHKVSPTEAKLLANYTDGTLCTFSWCNYTTRVNLVQFLIGKACIPLAVSIAMVPNWALFTKILGPQKQGLMNGALVGSGYLAMTFSPIIGSTLFQFYGPRVTWVSAAVPIAICVSLVAAMYKRLVPYEQREKNGYAQMDTVPGEVGESDTASKEQT